MSLQTITISTRTFSAYASLAEADAYLAGSIGPGRAAWTAAAADDRRRALVTATRVLDRLPWRGKPATMNQATAWPRSGVGTTVVPSGIEVAAILVASDLVHHPRELMGDDLDVKREQIGPKEAEYFRHLPDPLERTVGLDLASIVRPHLSKWLAFAPASPFGVANA